MGGGLKEGIFPEDTSVPSGKESLYKHASVAVEILVVDLVEVPSDQQHSTEIFEKL